MRPLLMVATKGYGLSIDDIDWSSPADMKPYVKAHREELKEKDYLAWISNQYTMSAVMVAVEHNLAGRKAKSKYIKEPIMSQIESQGGQLSEKDMQKKRELFVARLQAMKANWDMEQEKK